MRSSAAARNTHLRTSSCSLCLLVIILVTVMVNMRLVTAGMSVTEDNLIGRFYTASWRLPTMAIIDTVTHNAIIKEKK